MTEATIRVALWGKGLRVSQSTEEFQRLLPRDTKDLSGLEVEVDEYSEWADLMSGLHRLSAADLDSERCMLIAAHDITCVYLALTTDRYRRPSVLVLTGSMHVDWTADDIDQRISLAAGWLRALSLEYASIFSSNHERLTRQLREDQFLSSREFKISKGNADLLDRWDAVLATVKKWRGIRGVGTALLGRLGANTLLVRDKTTPSWTVDARIDGLNGNLIPLSDSVQMWPVPPKLSAASRPVEDPVARELRDLNHSFTRLVDLAEYIAQRLFGR